MHRQGLRRLGTKLKAGRWLLIAALATAPNVGCKSGITFWNPFAKPAPTPGSSMLQSDGDGGYIQAPQPQMNPPEPRAEEFGWTAPFKKFGDTISAPFKKSASNKPAKPITPESDAISLTSKQAPVGAKLHISLAQVQQQSGNVDSAIDQYEKALAEEPKNLQALLGIARMYDHKGDKTKALEYYKKAVKAHDQSSTAQNDLALCYYRNKQPKESIAALKKAIELDPDKALYRNNLAKIYVEQDRPDEAYRTLVGVHGEAVAHYNVGYMLKERGHSDEALSHFQAAAKLDPTLKQAQYWVSLLKAGETNTRFANTSPTTRSAPQAEASPLKQTPLGAEQFAEKSVAPAPTPVAKPSSQVAPSSLGPRYSQVSTPITPSPVTASTAAPQSDVGADSAPIAKEGAASVLAAARAVAQEPLGAGPDNVARSRAVPLKTVAVPASASSGNPPLSQPIPTPLVVPDHQHGRSSVDERALLEAANGATQPTTPVAPKPAPTPLPAPEEEEGPRLGKKTRPADSSVVGDRYATGGRYGVTAPATTASASTSATAPITPPQAVVPPLPGPYSRTTGAQDPNVAKSDPKAAAETATRPAPAARYPAGRY